MGVTETYEIDYVAKDSASAVTQKLIQQILALDAAVVALKAKLTGFATPGGRSAAAMNKQVQTLTATLAALQAQLQATNTQLKAKASNGNAATASIGKLTVALMAMHQVISVLSAIGDGLAKAREESERLAESNLKLRDSMRELANLQGKEGPDDTVVGPALLLGMASGLKPEEANKFLEQFEGSIPAGRQAGNVLGTVGVGGLTREKQEEFEREMAREGASFGARIGLDPATSGDLAGVVSQYTKVNKIEDFAGQLGAMAYGLNEGRGKISQLARSELGAAGNMIGSGHVKDLAELGAFVGVASTVSKSAGSAGTAAKQVDNLLNMVGGQTGDYLERAGVNKASGNLEKLRALRADLQANGGDDWNKYLNSKGFHNRTDRASTVAMAKSFDVLEQRVAKARQMAGDGAGTIRLDREFLRGTITGQNRRAEAGLAAAEFTRGKAGESVAVARKSAEARLKARGEIDTRATNGADALWDATFGLIPSKVGGGVDARRQRINQEMLGRADSEATMVGVQGVNPQVYKRLNRQDEVDAAFRDVSARIAAKGGDANGGMGDVVREVKKLVAIEQDKQKQRAVPQPVAPALPGPKPAPAPGRP